MLTYVIRRLLYSIVVLFVASMIIFCGHESRDEPARLPQAAPEHLAADDRNIEKRNHLDRPIYVRYAYWMQDVVTNKFGRDDHRHADLPGSPARHGEYASTRGGRGDARRPLAVGIGVFSALRQYSVSTTPRRLQFRRAGHTRVLARVDAAGVVREIYSGSTGQHLYVANLSAVDPGHGLHFALDRAWHLAFPVLVLMVASVATYSRYMRASMLEVVNADYVRTARAKGVDERKVTMRHAFRNALIPLVTIVALNSARC